MDSMELEVKNKDDVHNWIHLISSKTESGAVNLRLNIFTQSEFMILWSQMKKITAIHLNAEAIKSNGQKFSWAKIMFASRGRKKGKQFAWYFELYMFSF